MKEEKKSILDLLVDPAREPIVKVGPSQQEFDVPQQ
jgi:hypothetical protein